MNYTGNQYIPEGFTCLRILYTLVMDQIPIKCDMNDFSLGLKKKGCCVRCMWKIELVVNALVVVHFYKIMYIFKAPFK